MNKLIAVPITLREANDFVAAYHRHNGRTARNGGKWAIGVSDGENMIGVAIVGNPLSASFMDGVTAEVLRVCTVDGAQLGAASFLYSRCWRIWKEMGGAKLVTYTLQTEGGTSLKAAGYQVIAEASKVRENWNKGKGNLRKWQSIYGQQKFRWEISEAVTPILSFEAVSS